LLQVVIHRPGGLDRLCVEERAKPVPGPGEVLVEVDGVGVNFADVIVRMGLYSSAKEFVGWPITPGFEFAGRIGALGEGVDQFALGDEVVGVVLFGAYASHVCVPVTQLFPLPPGMTTVEAAVFPVVFLTAWYALERLCCLERGARILVHSAAGGVGGALLQLARIAGLESLAVVGATHKVATARALGASEVVDKSQGDLWRSAEKFAPNGFGAVFDANGFTTLKQSYAHLAPEGRLVVYGFHAMFPKSGGKPNPLRLAWDYLRTPRLNAFHMSQHNHSVMAFNLSYLFGKEELLRGAMSDLFGQVVRGELVKPEITEFSLRDVAKAHAALESGSTVGKLVLIP